jgi:flagellar protein FliO/FliZ
MTGLGIPGALAALLAVLGLIGLGARALRYLRPRLGLPLAGALTVQAVLPLDGRRRIYLIGCAGRRVLLLTGGAGDVVLGWLPPEAAP